MKTIIENNSNINYGKTTAGIIIIIIGGLLLIDQFNLIILPGWLFSWPMWLIAWGVYAGGRHNFANSGWLIMILLGIAFLCSENIANADAVIWPLMIIVAGIFVIMRQYLYRLR